MTSATKKRIVIVCRQAPYGSSLARESLDIALATSVFEQALAVVFTGDGVWQLLKNQDSNDIGIKNQGKLLSAFPVYDIDKIYIDSDALKERQLSSQDLILEGNLLTQQSLGKLINDFEIIFNF